MDEKDAIGEKLAPMPLDLGHYPARPAPTLGLVVEVNDLDLNAALGRSAHRTTEVRRHQPIQVLFCREFFAYKVQEYLREVGIKFRPIKPRSTHLNGKVERGQRIVLDEF